MQGLRPFIRAWFTSASVLSRRTQARQSQHRKRVFDADGWGVRMEEIQTTIAEEISIERCRELLGDEAERLSDEDVARIGRHAETIARVLIELFLEQRSRVH